jgi:5'-3' exonuclease
MLVGDVGDNVEGVRGIGPVKALKYLEGHDPEGMERTVRQLYNDDVRFELNKKLFKVLRSEEEYQNIISESERTQAPTVRAEGDPGSVSTTDAG